MTITVPLDQLGQVVAQLVQRGLMFRAEPDPRDAEQYIITLTGGY